MPPPVAGDIVIVAMAATMVRQAARVHREALAGSRTARMGTAYVRSFLDWFRHAEHGGIALAALDSQGVVVGYVIGAPLGYTRALSRHLAWSAAYAVLVRPWIVFSPQFRTGALQRVSLLLGRTQPQGGEPTLPAPTMSLVALGVSATARGQKIGLRLVHAFEEKARALRMRSLRLSTQADNVAARRLYERCGWRPVVASSEWIYYVRTLCSQADTPP
jgi:ribosomal protein S18 acetylase RimI-like enzyme